ncbi:hypothetical protein [Streptomyces sp. NPDC018059]|uniref:hypothetical protein n=1 Tax=Streptomyces sp. NPDC018059 TaxID=3365041 RepID=UPI0037B20815
MRRGMEIAHIAQLSRQAYTTIDRLLNGTPAQRRAPSQRLRPTTAAAILAVPAELDLIEGATEPALGGGSRRWSAVGGRWLGWRGNWACTRPTSGR